MKNDIRRYVSLRDALIHEKARLETRLREINEALGASEGPSTISVTRQQSGTEAAPARAGRRRKTRGGLSLRNAVLQITSRGALTKEEILKGVKDLGYKFSTKNPLNSLGVILYGKNPKFRNDKGLFSLAGGSTGDQAERLGTLAPAFPRKRRKLSPEARERISAAQRARWAKVKGK